MVNTTSISNENMNSLDFEKKKGNLFHILFEQVLRKELNNTYERLSSTLKVFDITAPSNTSSSMSSMSNENTQLLLLKEMQDGGTYTNNEASVLEEISKIITTITSSSSSSFNNNNNNKSNNKTDTNVVLSNLATEKWIVLLQNVVMISPAHVQRRMMKILRRTLPHVNPNSLSNSKEIIHFCLSSIANAIVPVGSRSPTEIANQTHSFSAFVVYSESIAILRELLLGSHSQNNKGQYHKEWSTIATHELEQALIRKEEK